MSDVIHKNETNEQTLTGRLHVKLKKKEKLTASVVGELEPDTILLLRCTLIGNHTTYV